MRIRPRRFDGAPKLLSLDNFTVPDVMPKWEGNGKVGTLAPTTSTQLPEFFPCPNRGQQGISVVADCAPTQLPL